jgi:voltage-gated hydrogen channel 1
VLVDLGYTLLTSDCEPPGAVDAPEWLEVLSLISTVITTLFLVEIPLTLWSLGLEFYNPRGRVPHAILHVFDAVIIVTTFVLEVVLRGKERELAGLLVILRLWRLLKLVGGE